MSVLKCLVCKETLPEVSSLSICDKTSCKEVVEVQQNLNSRIEVFSDFWKGKVPNDENYKTYLNMVGLDESYRKEAIRGDQPPKFSRRTWFTLNVINSHYDWPDEFGKKRSELSK